MARALSVLVLGISTIVLGGVLPVGTRAGDGSTAWVALPALALLAGVVLLVVHKHAMASAVLLVGVPAGLTVVLIAGDARVESFGLAGLGGASLALVAFGFAVVHAVTAARPLAQVTEKGLAGAAPTVDDGARRWLGRAWIGLGGLAAAVLVVVAPSLVTRAELRRGYGEAARDVEALVAAYATAAGLLVVGVAVAGAMRRTRRDGSLPRLRMSRALVWLAVTLVASVLLLLRRLE
ncbi:MAG: hypothetical protein IT379_07425 [Deltaproteobacteria bacterium]|nr:hypothetical protein [Deltaproteobacteria bacterium]